MKRYTESLIVALPAPVRRFSPSVGVNVWSEKESLEYTTLLSILSLTQQYSANMYIPTITSTTTLCIVYLYYVCIFCILLLYIVYILHIKVYCYL